MAYLPGLFGELPAELVIVKHGVDEYALDVAALTSNYRCIYGSGCRGTTPLGGERPGRHRPADPSVAGCCRIGPRYGGRPAEAMSDDHAEDDVDSPQRVMPFVDALRPDEAQHYDQIAAGSWYTEIVDAHGDTVVRNATIGGNCIFLNTETPEGRLGCSLYHLANRLGVDPSRTRPRACHVEPAACFTLADDLPGGGQRILVTLRPDWFGWFEPDGYFCTSDPAAYSAAEPVFRRMASEYSTLLGSSVYAALTPTLEQIWAERGERIRKSWGRPAVLELRSRGR